MALALALVCVAALSWCGTPVQAAKLRWKFNAGETLHYQLDQKTTTVMKPGGMEIKTLVTQTIDSTWVVKSVAADGSALLTMTFDRIRNKVDSSLAKFEYDSADKDKKDPEGPAATMMVRTLKALVGAEFKFKLSPLGDVSDIEVPKSLLDAMKSANPNSGDATMFTEDGWKNMVKESSLVFPPDDLAVGKGWSAKGTAPLWPGASLGLDKTYTYQGPGAKAEKIKLDVKMTLNAPANPNLEVKLVNPEGTGTFLFDTQRGRMVSADVTQKIALQIKAGGMEDTQSNEITNVMTLVDGKSSSPAK
jgi:hypothetical protein